MRIPRAAVALLGGLGACGGDDDGGFGAVSGAPELQAAIDVWAFSPTQVWVLDGGSAVHVFDGAAWSTLETPSTGGLGCVFARSTAEVWLCAGQEVLFYDGAAFTATEVGATAGLDGVVGLWASSTTDVWAIGDDAIVAHYDGAAWSGTITGSPFKSSIWGAGPDDVYALGTFDLVHYDGTAWTEVDLGPGGGGGGGDGQVWGTGPADVWVMTGSSELSHWDGAGWTPIATDDFVGDLAAVWGPSPDDLWAVGGAGAIAHYDGEAWRELTHQTIGAPYLRQFRRVHGSSSTDVWAVGSQLGEGGSTSLIYHRGP